MTRRQAQAPIALVTGATGGIGAAAAWALREEGFTVIGTARHQAGIDRLAAWGVEPLALDLRRDDAITAAADHLLAHHPEGIDVLVNNAAVGLYGAVEETPIEEAREQFEVNLFGLARLTQQLLPAMRQRGRGRIVNVSSMGGRIYAPLGAWYHASKHALEGWSDCLRCELAPFGITVVVVRPGIIRTPFPERMREGLLQHSGAGPYAPQVRALLAGFDRLYGEGGAASSPVVVGRTIVRAATDRRPRRRYAVGHLARPLPLLRSLLGDRGYDVLNRAALGPSR